MNNLLVHSEEQKSSTTIKIHDLTPKIDSNHTHNTESGVSHKENSYETPRHKTFDLSKYENIQEIYREELAPTSISIATVRGTDQQVAIKKIFKSYLVNDFQRKQAVQECLLHCSLNHRNIVKAFEWNENEHEYIIVLEYIDSATYFSNKIDKSLNPVKNENKLKLYVNDILEALAYLHCRGIIHGDLKLENILLDTIEDQEKGVPIVKLCDFGLSRVLDKETKKAYIEFPVGSTNYMAPEITSKSYIDEKVDMWALGIVLYKMAVAYKPTQISGYKYGQGPIPFRKVDWRKRSPELQDLIIKLLEMDPQKRISAEEALKHPWFNV